MPEIDELLNLSIAQYQQQLDQLQVIEAGQGPAGIEMLLQLQQQAQQTDGELLPLLVAAGPRVATHPLVRQRQELLGAVVAENRRLLPVFEGRKAVLAAELGQFKTGQVAMAGYRVGARTRGRRLSHSC